MTQYTDHTASQELAAGVMQRERRRIRLLIALTVSLWVLAALLLPAFYLPLYAKVMPRFEGMAKQAQVDTIPWNSTVPDGQGSVDLRELVWNLAVSVHAAAIATAAFLAIFTVTSVLAAISTIMLVLAVRRVTLRQVSENLAAISQQLRALQAGGA